MFLKTSVGIQRKIYENIPGGVSEWIPRRVNVKIKKKMQCKKIYSIFCNGISERTYDGIEKKISKESLEVVLKIPKFFWEIAEEISEEICGKFSKRNSSVEFA